MIWNQFPQNAYLAAPVVACLCTAVAVPAWRRWCRESGLVDDPGGRKDHASVVPLAGGPAILTGLLLTLALALIVLQSGKIPAQAGDLLDYGFRRRGVALAGILLGAVGMTGLGLWDDWKELRPGIKFIGQLLVAILVAASGVRITLFVPSVAFSFLVTVLWMMTLVNSMNFLDNMNGLCAGLGIVAAALFGIHGMLKGHYLVAMLSLVIGGALLGYLPFNFPKATVFLGDSGSHLTGYLLAVLGILPHFHSSRSPSPWAVVSPLLILAVPLFDIASVVFIRLRAGKPIWIGDHNHVSHRLVRCGLSRVQAVLVLWLVAAIVGAGTFFL